MQVSTVDLTDPRGPAVYHILIPAQPGTTLNSLYTSVTDPTTLGCAHRGKGLIHFSYIWRTLTRYNSEGRQQTKRRALSPPIIDGESATYKVHLDQRMDACLESALPERALAVGGWVGVGLTEMRGALRHCACRRLLRDA